AGHPQVEAVEPSVAIPALLAGPLGADSGYLLSGDKRVTLYLGDGRAQLGRLRDRYDRILVLGDAAFAAAPPLLDVDRLFTVEALKWYLGRLGEPRGELLLRVPRPRQPYLLATANEALGGHLAERAI